MLRNISKYQENRLKVHKVRLDELINLAYIFIEKPVKNLYFD